MKFKHAFHVFVDNFSVIYKQLLFRLIVLLVSGAICIAGVYPFIKTLIGSSQFNALIEGVRGFVSNLLNGQVSELASLSEKVQSAYSDLIELLNTKLTQLVLSGLLLLLITVVAKWFMGLGNYATASVINDKMALRAKQPFLGTLIRNLKRASIYNAIYVPLSVLFDVLVVVAMFFLFFMLLNSVLYFFICLFLFVLAVVFAITLKMTFTSDWLPALIRGKMTQGAAIKYAFSRKNKNTLNVMSNFAVIVLIVFALNVAALMLTFGVGLLITIPSSYAIIICFELVNYYDREEIKYSVDKNTIISPEKERPLSREEFFRGDGD
ncbi:MAG: hypothetical protein K2O89_00550 [Clostridia bacterium]|nr:hypothetical protein [Clostridia bacterium]